MLSLDDPQWRTLTHAYGTANAIPELIAGLAASPGPRNGPLAEPWFTLWSSLYHQGTVYDAAYAAVPHVVDIACETRGAIEPSFLLLPTSVELARLGGRGPAMPANLEADYHGAIARLIDVVSHHKDDPWDETMTICAAAAQALAKGHAYLAAACLDLDEDAGRGPAPGYPHRSLHGA